MDRCSILHISLKKLVGPCVISTVLREHSCVICKISAHDFKKLKYEVIVYGYQTEYTFKLINYSTCLATLAP